MYCALLILRLLGIDKRELYKFATLSLAALYTIAIVIFFT